jgi:ABC-type polar amino acid transport system ATPase subunit
MITIHDLHKRIRSMEVLRGVSLQVKRGEVAAVLGPSGGGKSTLLRTINGLETFDHGEIRVDTVTMRPAAGPARELALRQIRQRVGMVFQQFHLFPHRTVLQNVTEAPIHVLGQSRDQAEACARQLLDRVGLGDRLSAMPHQLSGGQQQRVAIARALALNPQAILFDEPTSALDPRMTAEVVQVMVDLARSGQTMIVVTHAMALARNVAHTVHVMHAGRIAESGPPEQIFDDPREDVTRTFLAEVRAT